MGYVCLKAGVYFELYGEIFIGKISLQEKSLLTASVEEETIYHDSGQAFINCFS